ncbi:MAG: hypothetical protein AB8B96_01845 [Lysobacterales bacterium]
MQSLIPLKNRLITLMTLAVLQGAPSVGFGKTPKCFPRAGHCVQVTVNGQQSVRLTKASKKLLKGYDEVSYYVDDTLYEILDPISGELDVVGAIVEGAEDWYGQPGSVDVQVVPLQAVEIAAKEELVSNPTVRIGGQAIVSKANVMQDNTLPPGRYLLRVKLRGSGNWDRQTLLLTVTEKQPGE